MTRKSLLAIAFSGIALCAFRTNSARADDLNFINITRLAGPDFVPGGSAVPVHYLLSLTLQGQAYFVNTPLTVNSDGGPTGIGTPEIPVLFYPTNAFLDNVGSNYAYVEFVNWRDPVEPNEFNTLLISPSGNRGTVTFALSSNETHVDRVYSDSSFGDDLDCVAGGVPAACPILTNGQSLEIVSQVDTSSARVPTSFTATFQRQEDLSAVPEPASILLIGSGLLGLAGRLRRRVSQT